MGTGIGEDCRCCGEQLTYDNGFDYETKLCDECRKERIPMVLKYLSRYGVCYCG